MLFYDGLFEDDAILAVNKKSGFPSHSLQKDLDAVAPKTVEAEVKLTYPEAELLHRLDTGTSGVLLFAKNNSIFKEMRSKFKLKQIKKFYVAWSETSPDSRFKTPLIVDTPIAHHAKSAKRMVLVEPDRKISYRGKAYPAVTIVHHFRQQTLDGRSLTALDVEIETGVTHQIRMHLKHLGYALVGDKIYNPKNDEGTRLGLHAHRVEFSLNGTSYKLLAPLPTTLKI